MVKYGAFILFLCVGLKAIGQQGTFLRLGTGVQTVQSYDLAGSPLSYSGYGFPLTLGASLNTRQYTHRLNIQATSSLLTNAYPMRTKVGTETREWHWVDISYTLLYSLKQKSLWVHSLGGSLRSTTFFRVYTPLDGYSWESVNGLFAVYSGAYLPGKEQVGWQVQLPILAYLHRPQFTLDEVFLADLFQKKGIVKYGEWSLPFDGFWQYTVQVFYARELSDALSLRSELMFEHYKLNYPKVSKGIRLQWLVLLEYRL